MYHFCISAVLLYYCFVNSLLLLHHCCTTTVQLRYCYCTTYYCTAATVRLLHHYFATTRRTTTVLLLCDCCTTTVPLLYYLHCFCTTAVEVLCYHSITTVNYYRATQLHYCCRNYVSLCTTIVRPLYDYCTTAVPLLYIPLVCIARTNHSHTPPTVALKAHTSNNSVTSSSRKARLPAQGTR